MMKHKAADNITIYACDCGAVHFELRDDKDRLFATAQLSFGQFLEVSQGVRIDIGGIVFTGGEVAGHA